MQRLLIAIILLLGLPGAADAQRCLSQRQLAFDQAADTAVARRRNEIEERLDYLELREVATIEVVVHVVWRTPAENISTEQIYSQLEVLNEDYRLLNANQPDILPIFQSVKADAEIEFVLASTDPAGNPSNGIVRVQTTYDLIGIARDDNNRRRICYSALGGSDAWCPDRYLNIWVGQFPGGIAGEASFPGQDIPAEDGIRIDPEHFGRTGAVAPPYHLGRTTTHEIGHYLNLYHLWGGDGDEDLLCQFDDEINDTPEQAYNYRNECPVGIQQSCGSPDMYQNYLNYTDDACMALFTLGQKMRMWATLNGPRSGLLSGAACSVAAVEPSSKPAVAAYPNPARAGHTVKLRLPPGILAVELLDYQGRLWKRQATEGLTLELQLEDTPPGAYFIRLITTHHTRAIPLVITR